MATAEGPLTGTTGMPASQQAATSTCPGSEMPGVPASQVRATVRSSASIFSTMPPDFESSLCRWQEIMGLCSSKRFISFMVTRVSSAATRSHSSSA